MSVIKQATRFEERQVDIHEVRPRLRFLLSKEAKAEGKKMANFFSTYSTRKDARLTSSQFRHIIASIRGGRFPNIARADEVLRGELLASLQMIVDGVRLPEWLVWRQTWANDLADGRPQRMAISASYMIEYQWKLDQLLDTAEVSSETNREEASPAPYKSLSEVADPIMRERLRRKMNDEASLAVFKEICPAVVPIVQWSRNMTEEDKATEAKWDEHRRLKEHASHLREAFEKLTGVDFEPPYTDRAELDAAYRAEYAARCPGETLSIRILMLGGYDE